MAFSIMVIVFAIIAVLQSSLTDYCSQFNINDSLNLN